MQNYYLMDQRFAECVKVYNYGRYVTSHHGEKKSLCSRNYTNGSEVLFSCQKYN